ncbi:ADP-ribosyl cyclase/cyclic ADP-ribose hydrolase-like isoform X2 [Hydractinia symbiolongicarpus]|uniref:ADP-ribosyl cyclase/cyclic ADP-ribose hydrolase-like isoform X2 n=1 Tax=Hydractinia symbiolongicarpus TaxID=13093 RepID=UPI00254CEC5E|nr:ADP-ribosyl cyclase/cyclic ADP-ribose hydrolase-like isoform X2 [Hydractinia symbiolongicarpus]
MFSIYKLLSLCLACHSLVLANSGTTPHLKDVFIGRCWQYQFLESQNKIDILKTNLNCTMLWMKFYNAFAFKDPCDVTVKSYETLFSMFDTSKKIPNSLFWSGSKGLVDDYTSLNDDYICLEDTITGYLFDGLQWCGSTTSPDGLNSSYCHSSNSTCNAMYPVWFLASAKFAERATKIAHTLLNASRSENRPAYYESSFFRTVEMPRLHVDKLIVLVASSIGQPVRESCDSQSILELKQDAKKNNIAMECIDQPKLVLQIFCLKYPKTSPCSTKPLYDNDNKEELKLWKWACIVLIAVALILLIIIGSCMAHSLIKKNRNFKYLHNWSFSRKPMLTTEESIDQSDNNNQV